MAVCSVVLYHAGTPLFGGGYVGVDVFFVISGYLISTLVLQDLAAGRFSLADFYVRRVRRIIPALFLVIFAVTPVAAWLLSPPELKEFSGSVTASVLLYANLFFARHSDYFDTAAELKPLLHLWSLSIEEQFYLAFPALLLVVRRLGRRAPMVFVVLGAVASLIAAQYLVQRDEAAFFMLAARAWELLFGVAVALVLAAAPGGLASRPGHAPGLAGLALIAGSVATFDGNSGVPGIAALVPTAGAALVILFAGPATYAGRFLAWRPLVGVGLISYSLYLWHYPLLALSRQFDGGERPAIIAAAVALAAVLAALTWRFVEQPFRRRDTIATGTVLAAYAMSAVALLSLGAAGTMTNGFRQFYLDHRLAAEARANYELLSAYALERPVRFDDGDCVFRYESLSQEFEDRFAACARKYGRSVVVLGDSHAINIHNVLAKAQYRPFLPALATGGCRPGKPDDECFFDEFVTFAERHRGAIEAVIFHQSGSHLLRNARGREDRNDIFLPGAAYSVADDNVAASRTYLEALGRIVPSVWLGPFLEPRIDFLDPVNFTSQRLRFPAESFEVFAVLDGAIRSAIGERPPLVFVSLIDAMRLEPHALVAGDCLTYRDTDHFSSCGEVVFRDRIVPSVDRGIAAGAARRHVNSPVDAPPVP